MSVSGVCMVGFFSTRGQNAHNSHSNTTANSSVDTTSPDSETDNTVLGIMVLYIHLIYISCTLTMY